MLTIRMKRNAFRVLATLAFAAAPAFASAIYVDSFETVGGLPFSCGTGCSYSTALPDWGGTATSLGQMRPGITAGLFTTLSDGATSAWSNGGTITQTLNFVVGTGTVYTLLVDMGLRADNGSFESSADLKINGNIISALPVLGAPAPGGWATYKATYTGNAIDAAALAHITIELKSVGVVGDVTRQGNFDNVRLDGVPEPASFLLIGSALLALKAFRRRRPIA
jgi:hypothetical protein